MDDTGTLRTRSTRQSPPRRRGRPPSRTRDQVVEAALAIAREDGVDAVSMRSVAARLGIHQTSLYTYVDSKDDLLTAMLDEVFASRLDLPAAGDRCDPVEGLRSLFRQLRALAVEHVELLALAGQLPVQTTAPVRTLEAAFRLLARTGLAPTEQGAIYSLLHHVTVASALVTGNQRRRTDEDGPRGAALPLPRVSEPSRYPHRSRLLATTDPAMTHDDAFEHMLTIVLDVTVPALVQRDHR